MKLTGWRVPFPADLAEGLFGGGDASFLIGIVMGMPIRRVNQLKMCYTPLS
ncbi:MAG: hypothetical protein MUF26_06095 [Syntrophales bacterium]|nr:hypothetical protein [Syntrophales bacterium]